MAHNQAVFPGRITPNSYFIERTVRMPRRNEAAKIIPFKTCRHQAPLSTITMTELYDNIYQTRPPVIDDLLYSGTYIVAGAPKVGKSFFMAQLAYHISAGIDLWEHHVHQGTVLYLALEDDHQRLQQRMSRMFGVDGTNKLHFAVEAPDLESGLESKLEAFIEANPDTRLIIIDTLQKILGNSKGSTYARDYEVMGRLKKFADAHGICMLIVHHTRKSKDKDIFNMISGSAGLLGCVDGAFLLHKDNRIDDVAILDVVGRDQPEQQIYLSKDTDTLLWNFEDALKEEWVEPLDPVLEAVNDMLTADTLTWTGRACELVMRLDLDIQPNALTKKLNVKTGTLFNNYSIMYERTRTRNGSKINLKRIAENRPA